MAKQKFFEHINDTLHTAEYVQIKSWLLKNEPNNPAIKEIDQAIEHSFSPRPFLHNFSNEANETFARVFLILKQELNKKK